MIRLLAFLALLVASPSVAQMHFSRGQSGPLILCQNAAPQSVTGTAVETTLATCTIPAGSMGANGQVTIEAIFTLTNSANNKTLKAKFGGTAFGSQVFTTTATAETRIRIANTGATNSQVGRNLQLNAYTVSANAKTTGAVDTTADVPITITGQLATTTETITLESYQVILYPKG